MTLRCLILGHRWTGHRGSLATLRGERTCSRCGHVNVWEVPPEARTAPMSEELRQWLKSRSALPSVDPPVEK